MRSIHTSTLTIYLSYMCVYIHVCISMPRDKQTERHIKRAKVSTLNSRNHVRNTRDMNKNNTILYFCYWTSCYAVTSV